MALGTCETGHIGASDDGKPRWDWGSRNRHLEGHTYEGAFGFYYGTWDTWRVHVGIRWDHAYEASPAEQVKVGRYGLSVGGYWGCLHAHPEIYRLAGR